MLVVDFPRREVPMQLVETALNVTRVARTAVASRRFDRLAPLGQSASGQEYFNMRQAMSLDPRMGKWISRVVHRTPGATAPSIPQPLNTRFADLAEVGTAVRGVENDGYYVFTRTAAPEVVEALRTFAEKVPCTARGSGTGPEVYPRTSPSVGRYDIEEQDALACPEVQEFATDPLLALVAERYLKQSVIMDEVAFWWTTSKRAEDANLNAQLFHQDRDRLSFLKFFIYLTDVTPDSGPHVYLRGSHRHIPRSLRADGRMTDDAVRSAGLWDNVRELAGPAGTILAVDTIGLHKGKTPVTGDRLALENEFATSLFGMHYEVPNFEPTSLTRERVAMMPEILRRYAPSVNP